MRRIGRELRNVDVVSALYAGYLATAGKVARQPVGDTTMARTYQTYNIPRGSSSTIASAKVRRSVRAEVPSSSRFRWTPNTRFRDAPRIGSMKLSA